MLKIKKIVLASALLGMGTAIGWSGVQTNAKAPDFTLTDTYGKQHKLSDLKGQFVVLEWTNYGCPFVKKHYDSGNMQALQKEYAEKKVVWLSICSSAEGKEGYMSASDWNKTIPQQKAVPTAVLIDAKGTVGKLYGAKTTPQMFVINPEGDLVYQGAIDDRKSTDVADVKGAVNYVKLALDEAMAGKKVTTPTTNSYGCSVKY